MDEYVFLADLLNKFSQLTPWVQALIGRSFAGTILGIAYFFKESVAVIMRPFCKPQSDAPKEENKEWRDKYYRGGTEQ